MPRKTNHDKQQASDKSKRLLEATKMARWKQERASPEYAAAAIALMRQLGKVTRQEYLEGMLELGWHEAMNDLEKHFHEHGLPLKEIPRTQTVIWP